MPKLISESGEVIASSNDYSLASIARMEQQEAQYNAKNPGNPVHLDKSRSTYSTTQIRGAKHGGLVSRGWGKARLPGGRK